MKLSLGPLALVPATLLALLALSAVGCSSGSVDDAASSKSNVSDATPIAPGKYVADGKVLMVYGACSEANFLGEAATGAIDSAGIMRAAEGDLCGGYKLATVAGGEVRVTWNGDPSAHLDGATVAACTSQEGTYRMTVPSSFAEPKAGVYAKGNTTFTIPAGCETPATLKGGGAVIARTHRDAEHPAGYLATDEGNVCEGYTYTGLGDGNLQVTWAPPAKASIAHDHGIAAACKSVEGIYKPR